MSSEKYVWNDTHTIPVIYELVLSSSNGNFFL